MTWEIREEIIDEHPKYLVCKIGAMDSQCAICSSMEEAQALVEEKNAQENAAK